MRLRTQQELDNGKFITIKVEETETYKIISWYLLIAISVLILIMGITIILTKNILSLLILLLVIPIYQIAYKLMKYLYLCETYVEDNPFDMEI